MSWRNRSRTSTASPWRWRATTLPRRWRSGCSLPLALSPSTAATLRMQRALNRAPRRSIARKECGIRATWHTTGPTIRECDGASRCARAQGGEWGRQECLPFACAGPRGAILCLAGENAELISCKVIELKYVETKRLSAVDMCASRVSWPSEGGATAAARSARLSESCPRPVPPSAQPSRNMLITVCTVLCLQLIYRSCTGLSPISSLSSPYFASGWISPTARHHRCSALHSAVPFAIAPLSHVTEMRHHV